MRTPSVCLAVIWAILLVGPAVAQEGRDAAADASGVGIVVAPSAAGQSLVVKDAEGKILDRIEGLDPETLYEYQLAPGQYEITLPDEFWPLEVEVKAGEVEILTIGSILGLGAGEADAIDARVIYPASRELTFSLDPKPGTDDPGPMAPE